MKKLTLIIIILLYLNSYSQTADRKIGAWYMNNGSYKVSEKWKAKSLAPFGLFETTKNLQ